MWLKIELQYISSPSFAIQDLSDKDLLAAVLEKQYPDVFKNPVQFLPELRGTEMFLRKEHMPGEDNFDFFLFINLFILLHQCLLNRPKEFGRDYRFALVRSFVYSEDCARTVH